MRAVSFFARFAKGSSVPAALALSGAFILTNAAGAADLRGPVYPEREIAAAPAKDFATGWYLRGDITASLFGKPESDYVLPGVAPIGPIDYRNEKIKNAAGIGAGVGVRYRSARFDVTYDARRQTRYGGDVPPFNNWAYVGPFPVPSRRDRFDLTTRTVLANGYYDLGTWRGITPYVGAGAGATYVSASNYVSEPRPLTAALGGVVINSRLGSAAKWNFTWALMAGVSASLTKHLKVDVGYRYVDMGTMKFNHVDAAGAVTANIQSRKLRAHELRVGLRYEMPANLGLR